MLRYCSNKRKVLQTISYVKNIYVYLNNNIAVLILNLNTSFLDHTGKRERFLHKCLLPEGGTQRAESLYIFMVTYSSTNDRWNDLTEAYKSARG